MGEYTVLLWPLPGVIRHVYIRHGLPRIRPDPLLHLGIPGGGREKVRQRAGLLHLSQTIGKIHISRRRQCFGKWSLTFINECGSLVEL